MELKQKNSSLTLLSFIVLTLCVVQSSTAAKLTSEVTSYLTAKQIEGVPGYENQKDFTCSDQVYLVIETAANEATTATDHQLSVIWHNPHGKVEQRTLYDFTHFRGGSRVWAWLRLSGPPSAAIARLFDPAFGMGEFIGTWSAEVKIDRKKVATHEFEVLC